MFPGQTGYINPSACSWFYLRVCYQLDLPGISLKGDAKEASWSDAQTTSTGPFWYEGGAALLWTPYPISKAEPSHPTELSYSGRLYLRSHSFGHYPKLTTIGEGQNVNGLVIWQFCLPAQVPTPASLLNGLSISHSILPLVIKTSRYLWCVPDHILFLLLVGTAAALKCTYCSMQYEHNWDILLSHNSTSWALSLLIKQDETEINPESSAVATLQYRLCSLTLML